MPSGGNHEPASSLQLIRGDRTGVRARFYPGWIAGMCLLGLTASPLTGAYRKEQPVGLIITAEGGKYQPSGTRTPLGAHPGILLFQGDMLYGAGGSVHLLWCPDGAARKFEYTIQGDTQLTLDISPPSVGQGKELDVCLLPAVERTPEVTTLPSLDQMLPPPLAASTAAEDMAATPPATAAALQAMARRNLSDPRIRISFATMLIGAGLYPEAVDQLGELAKLWPDEVRFGRLIQDLLESGSPREIIHPKVPVAKAPAPPSGRTYALVIGIKHYEQDGIPDLLFSEADAKDFADFMTSPRGGKAEVVPLINQQATVAAIRNNLIDLLAKLGKNDTFVLFIAAHGDMQQGTPTLVTYRANPQDTSIDGLPLSEIQKLRFGEQKPFRELRIFLDICHAGYVAPLDPYVPKGRQPTVPPPPPELLYLAATHSGPDAVAYEDPIFGHGVFSYFLLRGLESNEARAGDNRFVTADSLSNYVVTWVRNATKGAEKEPRQVPDPQLGVPLGSLIANLDLPAPKFEDSRPLKTLVVPANRLGKLQRQVPISKHPVQNSAETPAGTPANLDRRIALEDEGEGILLRYLEGDEIPQTVEVFRHCADLYAEALGLQPGSPYLEARRVFCQGRALVFDKRYDGAIERLERAIRLDPAAAYSYNALGIAYLEKGDYTMARAAFEDAIGRAPKWAYPRHSLALVHTQTGNYAAAIAAYRDAMERAPDYSYLPYNLGLVFQRMNRTDDAEAEYLQAIAKANRTPPGRAEPYVALGALKASQKKWKTAEGYYRKALGMPADELTLRTARHDLAVMLSRNDAGRAEAERLWGQNGNYVPSQLSLAESLAARGQTAGAIQLYRGILSAAPGHLSARLLLAEQLEKAGDRAAAISELRTALSIQPDNPVVFERLAASLIGSGSEADAARLLRTVFLYGDYGDPDWRSRMQKAIKRLEQAR